MPHAHSLFVNTLAERGACGLVALILFLGSLGANLIATIPSKGAASEDFLFWGSAFSSWFIGAAAGLANTTLHHEHALLSVLLFGSWLSWRRSRLRRTTF
jgi:hypothetical protein